MLNMIKSHQMTDIIHGTISYSGIEHEVISTPIFNRLHRVLQSSLVFLTYSSNKVKRFEHSMGVMHIAGKLFFNSICNATDDTLSAFIDKISEELINWRNNINFEKYSFVQSELRNQYIGERILEAPIPKNDFYNFFSPNNFDGTKKFQYFVVFQAIRLAGLLHDVGHLPYSHILEHALKKMYYCIKEKSNHSDVENIFLDIMKRFADGEDEIHEEIGKLLVNNIRNSIIQSIGDKSDPNIYFFLATFDFAEKIMSSSPSDNNIYSSLHTITASVLDADRLDYCTRDSYCSGINKSIFLYDRLLNTYTLSYVNKENFNGFCFCPSAKSKSLVEELLRKRVAIFSEINYHHRVHKHEILLEEVISTLGIEEINNLKNITELSYSLPLNVSSIWQLISKLDSSNDWPEYQIIQLDDSWLDTLLKSKFFDKYKEMYLSLRENGNDILWNKFDELISTTKRYHSFFKSTTDFNKFDKLFFISLKDKSKNLLKYNEKLAKKILSYNTYNDFFNENHSFVFNYCIETLFPYKELYFTEFEQKINSVVSEYPNIKIVNCLLRSCMFSFGYHTAKNPLFLLDRDNEPIEIAQLSSQLQTFQNERAISPIFHLYYLPYYEIRYNGYADINYDYFRNMLVKTAIDTLIDLAEQLASP